MKAERPRPTESEISILRVLWENGPLSVCAVLKKLNEGKQNEDKATGYTTVLKLMQIMTDKGRWSVTKHAASDLSDLRPAGEDAAATAPSYAGSRVRRFHPRHGATGAPEK